MGRLNVMSVSVIWLSMAYAFAARIGSQCNGGNGYVYHEVHKNKDVLRCCKQITCPPGEYPEVCGDKPDSTKCNSCPAGRFSQGSFTSGSYYICNLKVTCFPNKVKIEDGSSTKDAECGCDKGMELKDDWCEQCTHGTFKPRVGQGKCKAWRNCTGATLEAGSHIKDRICAGGEKATGVASSTIVIPRQSSANKEIRTTKSEIQEENTLTAAVAEYKPDMSYGTVKDLGKLNIVIGCSIFGGVLSLVVIVIILFYLIKRKQTGLENDFKSPASDVRSISVNIAENASNADLQSVNSEKCRSDEFSKTDMSDCSSNDLNHPISSRMNSTGNGQVRSTPNISDADVPVSVDCNIHTEKLTLQGHDGDETDTKINESSICHRERHLVGGNSNNNEPESSIADNYAKVLLMPPSCAQTNPEVKKPAVGDRDSVEFVQKKQKELYLDIQQENMWESRNGRVEGKDKPAATVDWPSGSDSNRSTTNGGDRVNIITNPSDDHEYGHEKSAYTGTEPSYHFNSTRLHQPQEDVPSSPRSVNVLQIIVGNVNNATATDNSLKMR